MRMMESVLPRRSATPPVVETAAEMATCLRRFLSATADEQTMRRARAALESWDSTVRPGPVSIPA